MTICGVCGTVKGPDSACPRCLLGLGATKRRRGGLKWTMGAGLCLCAALVAYAARWEPAPVAAACPGTPVASPEPPAAPPPAETEARSEPPPVAAPAPRTAAVRAPARPLVSPPEKVDCDDLVALEPGAMRGELSSPQVACLEDKLAHSTDQSEQRLTSQVLMANAYSAGNTEEWARLAERHVMNVDGSDPTLPYKLALYYSKREQHAEVIRLADVALEHCQKWVGETYTQRVGVLYRLRAASTNALWTSDGAEGSRRTAFRAAREWYDFTRAAGTSSETAMALCRSLATESEECRE